MLMSGVCGSILVLEKQAALHLNCLLPGHHHSKLHSSFADTSRFECGLKRGRDDNLEPRSVIYLLALKYI